MSSVLYHFWLFLSGKSQIVNISSLREIINSFCTYSFSVSANWWFSVCYNLQQQQLSKTILHSESRGNMNTLTLSLASHSICLCPVLGCVLHTGHHCTESPATTPDAGEGQAWGGAAQTMVPFYTTFWTLGQLLFSLNLNGQFMCFLNTGERRRSKNLANNFLMTIQLLWNLNFLHSSEVLDIEHEGHFTVLQ